jgi:hypothetical protein
MPTLWRRARRRGRQLAEQLLQLRARELLEVGHVGLQLGHALLALAQQLGRRRQPPGRLR